MFDLLRAAGFDIAFHSHAEAILSVDFGEVATQLEATLLAATIPIEEIIGSGGGETKGTQRLRRALHDRGWLKHKFEIQRTVDGVEREAISHEVDHVARFAAGVVALEIEWNNKDPFFDRDLENYKRLHSDGAISLGIIITRGASLQDEMRRMVLRFATEAGHRWNGGPVAPRPAPDSSTACRVRASRPRWDGIRAGLGGGVRPGQVGDATTHWRKLEDRVRRGVGNPCPLLVIGLPARLVTFGEPQTVIEELIEEGGASVE